jgi:hypothetical protein
MQLDYERTSSLRTTFLWACFIAGVVLGLVLAHQRFGCTPSEPAPVINHE